MPNPAAKHDMDWYRHAIQLSHTPAAFVRPDGYFSMANQAWCELLERSESTLLELHWKDVTPVADIGDDERECQAILDGSQTEYYDAKHFLMPGGRTKPVGIWVYRHPLVGAIEGLIVFAGHRQEHESPEDVRVQFASFRQQLMVLEGQASGFADLKTELATDRKLVSIRFAQIEQQIVDLKDVVLASLKSPSSASVNVGGDYSGVSKSTSNNATMPLVVITAVCVIAIASVVALIVGGRFHYGGGGSVNIQQPLQ